MRDQSGTVDSAGPIDTASSGHAALRTLPMGAFEFGDGFWDRRQRVNRDCGVAPRQTTAQTESIRTGTVHRSNGRIGGDPSRPAPALLARVRR